MDNWGRFPKTHGDGSAAGLFAGQQSRPHVFSERSLYFQLRSALNVRPVNEQGRTKSVCPLSYMKGS